MISLRENPPSVAGEGKLAEHNVSLYQIASNCCNNSARLSSWYWATGERSTELVIAVVVVGSAVGVGVANNKCSCSHKRSCWVNPALGRMGL